MSAASSPTPSPRLHLDNRSRTDATHSRCSRQPTLREPTSTGSAAAGSSTVAAWRAQPHVRRRRLHALSALWVTADGALHTASAGEMAKQHTATGPRWVRPPPPLGRPWRRSARRLRGGRRRCEPPSPAESPLRQPTQVDLDEASRRPARTVDGGLRNVWLTSSGDSHVRVRAPHPGVRRRHRIWTAQPADLV